MRKHFVGCFDTAGHLTRPLWHVINPTLITQAIYAFRMVLSFFIYKQMHLRCLQGFRMSWESNLFSIQNSPLPLNWFKSTPKKSKSSYILPIIIREVTLCQYLLPTAFFIHPRIQTIDSTYFQPHWKFRIHSKVHSRNFYCSSFSSPFSSFSSLFPEWPDHKKL